MDYLDKIKDKYLSEEYEEVVRLCEEAIKKLGQQAVYFYYKGLCNQKNSDFEESIKNFDRAIELNNTNNWYYYQRAWSKNELGRYSDALTDVNIAIDMGPEDEDLYTLLGDINRTLKKFDEAEKAYLKAIEIKPDYAFLYYMMAEFKESLELYNSALVYHDKAIALEPYNSFYYYAKTYSSFELDNLDEGIQLLSHAILLNPDNPDLYERRAVFYQKQKQFEETLKDFAKAINLKPNNAQTYIFRANLFSDLKKYKEALDDYNIGIMLSSEPDETLFNSRGVVRGKLKQYDFAIKDFEQALKINPNYSTAMMNLGCAYGYKEEYQTALKYLNLACMHDENSSQIYYFRASIFEILGNFDSAAEDYQRALKINPEYEEAKKGLEAVKGKLPKFSFKKKNKPEEKQLSPDSSKKTIPLNKGTQTLKRKNSEKKVPKQMETSEQECGQVKQKTAETGVQKLNEHLESARNCLLNGQAWHAIEECRQALRIDSENEVAYCRMGVGYFLVNKYSEALKSYQKAIDLKPNYALAYCNIGVLKEKQGNYTEAFRYYDKALYYYPKFQKAEIYKNNLQIRLKNRRKRGDFEDEF